MASDDIARVEDLYAAFSAGDWARVLGAFSEDVVWTQPGTTRLSGTHRGRDAVVAFFLDILRYELTIEPLEYFHAGDRVAAVLEVGLAGERANEVELITLRDGLIVAVEHIGDTEMLTRALGPAAPVAETIL